MICDPGSHFMESVVKAAALCGMLLPKPISGNIGVVLDLTKCG
jgi:hypothetical protein